MTQLANEAAVGGANDAVDTAAPSDPFEDFADALGLDEDGSETEEDEEEGAGEASSSDEDEDGEGEAGDDLPPIEPPVSWKADDKEAFKALPREMQETIATREAERERFVQAKSQEAAHVRQSVENEARSTIAQLQQQTAQELQRYAALIEPQRPNPAMLAHDPQGFYHAQAQYEAALAQRQQAQQQAEQYQFAAQQQLEAIQQAEMAREVETLKTTFPEWFDPSTSANLQQGLTAIAREMGYSEEHVSGARAIDILAMRKAAEWKAKADQLDKLNRSKMEKVREAKALPKVSKPGVAHGKPSKQARADAAWQGVKTARSKDAQANAFADFMEASGLL